VSWHPSKPEEIFLSTQHNQPYVFWKKNQDRATQKFTF
jgi:hypothetical protein